MKLVDIEKIKADFAKVITYSQGIENPQLNAIFDKWWQAKQFYMDAWAGLIYESSDEITFELSEKEKQERLNEFINTIYDSYGNYALGEFLYNNRDDFFKNHLTKDYYMDDITVPKGSKILRAFKFFESDQNALHLLQTEASMIIQENKIKGKLCFSVHPLDYLSVSENSHHWRSCHALDGDYRTGNIGYMTDKATIICYLKGEEDVKLPRFPEDVPWNSKKWRTLGFFSNDKKLFFAGRQYPFFSDTGLDVLRGRLLRSLGFDYTRWSNFHNDYISTFPRKDPTAREADHNLNGKYISFASRIYNIRDIVMDKKHSLHFNDLLESSCYIPYYTWERPRWWADPIDYNPPVVEIGDEVKCLCCGSKRLETSSMMRCLECESKMPNPDTNYFCYCACCDSITLRSDAQWNFSIEGFICPSCVERESQMCDACTDLYYKCDLVYDREHSEFRCPKCTEANGNHYRRVEIVFGDEDLPF